jgi:hypothetical protein
MLTYIFSSLKKSLIYEIFLLCVYFNVSLSVSALNILEYYRKQFVDIMLLDAVQSQVACQWRENKNSDVSFRLVKSYIVKDLFNASNIRVACFVEGKPRST